MRSEKDENISIIWYMMCVSLVASSARERYTTQPAHIEALTPLLSQSIIETCWGVIDFIDTDAACEQSVLCIAAK